jgi:Tol biopolymer transport system component
VRLRLEMTAGRLRTWLPLILSILTGLFTVLRTAEGQWTGPQPPTWYWSPVFSPDGKWIAFHGTVRGNMEIFLCRSDGSELRNLTRHSPGVDRDPLWSPDGRFILFQSERTGEAEIYRMTAEGSEITNLSRDPQYDADARWSPDGSRVLFWRATPEYKMRDGQRLLSDFKNAELVIAQADGSGQRVLTAGASEANWSPDGAWIVFQRTEKKKRVTWLIRPDGSEEHRLGEGHILAWTPDSKALVAWPFGSLVNVAGAGRDENSQTQKLLEGYGAGSWSFALDPSLLWDPSHARIALAVGRLRGTQDRNGIVILDRQGAVLADLRENGNQYEYCGQLSWSPDGERIAFSYRPAWPVKAADYHGGIFTMRADGSDRVNIVPDGKLVD